MQRGVIEARARRALLAMSAATLLAIAPRPASAQTEPTATTDAPPRWRGFRLAVPEHDAELRVRGLVQADGVFVVEDANRFEIRRARVALAGTVGDVFGFRVEPQLTPGGLALLDAYVDARLVADALVLRAGKTKTALGIEMLQSISALRLPERGPSTALVPNRDLGLSLFGELEEGVLAYTAMVGSGARDGGRGDDYVDGSFDVYGRLFVQPFRATALAPLQRFGIGIAGSYGEEHGAADQSGLPRYRTGTRATFARYVDGARADGRRWRVNPQLHWYWGPFGAIGEYVYSAQRIRSDGHVRTVGNHAWILVASFVLTQEDASFGAVTPAHEWGAFELAARYGELHLDQDAFAQGFLADAPRVVRAWGAALNYWAAAVVRVQLAFEQTLFFDALGADTSESALYLRVQAAL